MNSTSLSTVTQWAEGRLQNSDGALTVSNVSTDSRSIGKGDLFIALRGENFDAHKFLDVACESGAAALMIDARCEKVPSNIPVLIVEDTLKGLQSVARNYRQSLEQKVVGITGSNGKTSTKDLTAGVLSQKFRVSKTEGNLNNHIGVPLTLLRSNSRHDVQVVELGMNHPGEIAPLAALARPDIGIITSIGVAHIEYMGSREAIAQEKGELFAALPESGHAILSAEEDFYPALRARTKAHVMTTGFFTGDVRATEIQQLASGMKFMLHFGGESLKAEIPLLGEHMVRNALLATACGLAMGLDLATCAEGLREQSVTIGRLTQKQIRGFDLLDDTYNANPDSVAAALVTLARMPGTGRRVAVLGRMGELGAESEHGHRRVGEIAGREGIHCVIAVGDESRWIADAATSSGVANVIHVGGTEEATTALLEFARPGDAVLVKGSRSSRMERIVHALEGGDV